MHIFMLFIYSTLKSYSFITLPLLFLIQAPKCTSSRQLKPFVAYIICLESMNFK